MFGPLEKRTHQIVVKLSPKERQFLDAQAAEQKVSLSEALRRLVASGIASKNRED